MKEDKNMNSEKYDKLMKQREEIDQQIKELHEKETIKTERSDDYAILKFDDLEFYYGYETLDEEENEELEWNFYVIKDGNKKSPHMKLTENELQRFNSNINDVQQGLATGIALYIRTQGLNEKKL